MVGRIANEGLKRDEARRVRKEETESAPRPQSYSFNFEAADGSFLVRFEFRKSEVSREELSAAVRAILRQIEAGSVSSSAA
jgi:hypothetical protein